MAESFVDFYKTELIADRVWRSRTQVELATVEYPGWFNGRRLHEALGDIPPVEFEQLHAARALISVNGSLAGTSPRSADGFRTRRLSAVGVDFVADGPISPENASVVRTGSRSGRDNGGQGTNGHGWPLRSTVQEHAR
jgi:hypothetical protein